MEIKRLTPELLQDWLQFFDKEAFTDNDEWSGCYCMCYHWNKALARKKSWNCSVEDASFNRECAIKFIEKGKMQGYLAYENGNVVGWCNANDKKAYDNVNFEFPVDEAERGKKVKCVVCFCIAPGTRGQGVASLLLERVCADAAAEEYDFVEAYPFQHDSYHAYHGPQRLYEKFGFEQIGRIEECNIFRKVL